MFIITSKVDEHEDQFPFDIAIRTAEAETMKKKLKVALLSVLGQIVLDQNNY